MRSLWLWSLAGPLLFLAAIVLLSVGVSVAGTPPEQIAAVVAGQAPAILLGVLAVLGVAAFAVLPWRQLWQGRPGWAGLGWGVLVGAVLAVLYVLVLAPLLTAAQTRFGDFVPPGSVLGTISGNVLLFFVADVLLAPLVEETVYRGHLLRGFVARFGQAGGIALSCLAFGALHWTGGLWYMLLTGLVAGLPLALLALRSGGLAAAFAAHLTLNVIEFGWVLN